MKRLIIIGLSLCSVLLYGCGSVSDSSQDKNMKAEESVVESQNTELFTEENEGNGQISDDVSEDVDNIGLPYDGVYDENMGFNLDGIDYHFPVTPNDILLCGLYEFDPFQTLEDDIIEPGKSGFLYYRSKADHDASRYSQLSLEVENRTDAPLKACECEVVSIGLSGNRSDIWGNTLRDGKMKLTDLNGYGFEPCTVSDILQAYGTPEDGSYDHSLRYTQTAENGLKCTVVYNIRQDNSGECDFPKFMLSFVWVDE